jgi:hypothetical protein
MWLCHRKVASFVDKDDGSAGSNPASHTRTLKETQNFFKIPLAVQSTKPV